jgi:hypothetical protein
MYSAFGKKGGKGKGKKAPKKEGGTSSSGGSGGGNGARAVDTSRKDFIYQMSRLTKSYGKGDGASTVLKSVNLAFYPGTLTPLTAAHVYCNCLLCDIAITDVANILSCYALV